MGLVPQTRKATRNSVKMEDEVWERMLAAAKTLSEEARSDGRDPYTRDDLVEHACKRWLEEWEADRERKKKR